MAIFPAALGALGTTARVVSLGALLLVAAACGSVSTNVAPLTPVTPSNSASLDVTLRTIGSRTLQAEPTRSLYDVVHLYWPNVMSPPWQLLTPVLATGDRLGVYANGNFAGTLDLFRDVPANKFTRVRRLTPAEEMMEFGRQHTAGAIVLDWAPISR
jgi:hypothetical protein